MKYAKSSVWLVVVLHAAEKSNDLFDRVITITEHDTKKAALEERAFFKRNTSTIKVRIYKAYELE